MFYNVTVHAMGVVRIQMRSNEYLRHYLRIHVFFSGSVGRQH